MCAAGVREGRHLSPVRETTCRRRGVQEVDAGCAGSHPGAGEGSALKPCSEPRMLGARVAHHRDRLCEHLLFERASSGAIPVQEPPRDGCLTGAASEGRRMANALTRYRSS